MKEMIEKTLSGLKDFQRRTVDYVLHQFDAGRDRMLIADEVGLGKTIVAKGIVARLFERKVLDQKKKTFNVVYVCSNQAIASANINKLNFSEDASAVMASREDDRITSLAYADQSDDPSRNFSIRAFTPATSFDDKTHAGRKDERVMLYRLLYDYADIYPYKNSLKWILKGNNRISEATWECEIYGAERGYGRQIRGRVSSEFRRKMDQEISPETLPKSFRAAGINGPVKYWTLLNRLCQLEVRKNNYHQYNFGRELISHLRLTLSQACLTFLHADLFILDEFQRYKKLIERKKENEDDVEQSSPAVELARTIFSMEGTKVLMLSATPFKAYTTDYDEINGEVHHEEFETVLRFLNTGLPEKAWTELANNKSELFSFLRHFKNDSLEKARVLNVKNGIEGFYRKCMVRTERLNVSKDKEPLTRSMLTGYLDPELNDLEDFVALDQLTLYLNRHRQAQLPIPLEYVKSSPYALSFLEGYQHRKQLMAAVTEDAALAQMLKRLKHAWVELSAVSKYQPLATRLPNGKLRLLLAETVEKGAWKLLWIPPSMPYYEFGEPYLALKNFSKALVFSSWLLVPRMISSLVSYEAERECIGDPASVSEKEKEEEKREYFAKKRHPRPQIVYRTEKKEGKQILNRLMNMVYLYPSPCLAQIYDPQNNLTDNKPLERIRADLKLILKERLMSPEMSKYAGGNGDWQAWYWAAPAILDRIFPASELMKEWFENGLPRAESVIDSEDESQQHADTGGKEKHFNKLKDTFLDPAGLNLPSLTEAQAEQIAAHLATLTLASPAVCYLRTQLRYEKELSIEILDGAFEVASGFVTTFNKPESIAVIRLCTGEDGGVSYLERVMEYSLAGNMQAMLDEYFYLIREIEGLYSLSGIAAYISDMLSIRSVRTKVDDLSSFLRSASDEGSQTSRSLRTHFAVDFAGKKLSTAKTSDRQISIRQAFNSPFRPFVLATTSIGQEGLDFHLYCRKIFHWNLPANAIDLEQREGRINRYKSLLIRQSLVRKYMGRLSERGSKNVWEAIFKIAEQNEGKGIGLCEMVPFWHTETDDDLKIERFVPLYSFSRDISKYAELRKVLMYYRVTFGQPMQDELIAAISKLASEDDLSDLKNLLIDLSPMSFYKNKSC